MQMLFAITAILFAGSVLAMMHIQNSRKSLPSLAVFSLPKPEPYTVKYQVASMTLEEKIGQMFVVSFKGTKLDAATETWMRNLKIGGVLLLGGNVATKEQVSKLIIQLNEKVSHLSVAPLFIAVDQEGGKVSRFTFDGFEMHAQRDIGNGNDAYAVAFRRGKELKALGVNVNFSPVLDTASSSLDFMYDRAFVGNEKDVATYGVRMIEGYRDSGIASVAKHFPGHGGTQTNSHIELPVAVRDEELWRKHLYPFRAAIGAHVPMIMMAHIKVSNIDENYPASLSKKIVTDILRNGLSYDGVIVSDDLGMGAISKKYSVAESAVRAVVAGTDILIVVRGSETYEKMIIALEKAVKDGVISENRIDESVERILKLKHELTIL